MMRRDRCGAARRRTEAMPWVSDVKADIGPHSATLLSPAPRLGLSCIALLVTVVVGVIAAGILGPGPYLIVGALLAAGAAAALIASARSFRTTFDGDTGQATVETRGICGRSVHSYPFGAIDALAVTEGCVVELHLRDGTAERLSYAHETFSQLDKLITGVCAATGIAKGSPNVVRAPFEDGEGMLSERGMGLYVEGRFAILATSTKLLSFRWLTEVVFNLGRREMTVIRTTPLRRTLKVVPFHEVDSIGLDGVVDRETRAYSYRGVIRLKNGRGIRLFGETPAYSRYNRILAKVRDLTGISKQDHIQRRDDHGATLRGPP
jgi:hypothetical protein